MSKKTKSSIYHFENYIQIQKLNFVLKRLFNNDQLTIEIKRALEFIVRSGYSLCSQSEKASELMFKKYFKILSSI